MCPAPPDLERGAVAQMVERLVRNEEVWGSIPHGSTRFQFVIRLIFLIMWLIAGKLQVPDIT